MKQTKLMFSLVVVATISALMVVFTGCEDDPDIGSDLDSYFSSHPFVSDPREESDDIKGGVSISPNSAVASSVNQQFDFVVTGGESPFTWDVANANGTIVGQEDTRYGIYTVSTVGENNIIVSDKNGKAAIADITLYVSTLTISPSSTTVSPVAGTYPNVATFTCVGGTAPYSWSLGYGTIGTLNTTAGTSVNYTYLSNTNIDNTITVTDSKGNIDSASITHRP